MPLLLFPLVFGGGAVAGWWGTTETVEAVTGGKDGRPPYLAIIVVLALLFVAWRKGWIK